MAKIFFSSLSSTLLLLSLFSGAANLAQAEADDKTWCVAKPSSDAATLTANLNYACSQLQVDCSVLRIGCACGRPDSSLISRASVAMNLYYQAAGRHYWNCFFNDSALVTTTDPSFDICVYAFI